MNHVLNRTSAPTAKPLKASRLPSFQKLALSNGLPVYFLPFGTVEVAEVQLVFKAGKGFQPAQAIAGNTAKMMMESTSSLTNRELAERLDDYGAWISHDAGVESVSVSLTALSRHLPDTMPLLQDVVSNPAFSGKEWEQAQNRALQKLKVHAQKTAVQAAWLYAEKIYGADHPYGIHTSEQALEAVELEALKKYHQQYLHPGNAFLLVTGIFDEAATLRLLEDQFGGLPCPAGNDAVSAAAQPRDTAPAGRYHKQMEGEQSSLCLGHPAFARDHADFYAMQIVNTILGGYFGSRLMKNIREDKGYTYGIYSGWVASRHAGHFIVRTDVGNEYVEDTILQVKTEIARLQNEAVSQKELELVKNYLLGKSISQRETLFQMGNLLRFSVGQEISFQELDRRYEVIENISSKDIQQLAQTYFQPDQMIEVVCGEKE